MVSKEAETPIKREVTREKLEQRVARDPERLQIENRVALLLREKTELDGQSSRLDRELSQCLYFGGEPIFRIAEGTSWFINELSMLSNITQKLGHKEMDFADLDFLRLSRRENSESDWRLRRGKGEDRFQEVKTFKDGTRAGSIGSMAYFLNEEGQAISPGFQNIILLPDGSYKVEYGNGHAVLERLTKEEQKGLKTKSKNYKDLEKSSLQTQEVVDKLRRQEIFTILDRYYGIPKEMVQEKGTDLIFNDQGLQVKLTLKWTGEIGLKTFGQPLNQEDIEAFNQELEKMHEADYQSSRDLEPITEEEKKLPGAERHYRGYQRIISADNSFLYKIREFQVRTGYRHLYIGGGSLRFSLPIAMGLARSPAEQVSQWLGQTGDHWLSPKLQAITPGEFSYQRDWKFRPETWTVDQSGKLKRSKFLFFNL